MPRGGRALIERVAAESRIPVLKHLDGICHTYVDGGADPTMARKIVLNAKMRRTGICGATETLLVDRRAARSHLPPLIADLIAAGCELRGDAETRALDPRVKEAAPEDWDTEYLDAILSVRVVDGVEEAIAPHRPPRLQAHGGYRHRRPRRRRTVPRRRRCGHRHGQRLDPVRRRRRVRHGRRDRHLDRQAPCPRTRRAPSSSPASNMSSAGRVRFVPSGRPPAAPRAPPGRPPGRLLQSGA